MSSINRFSQSARFVRVARLLLWTLWVIYRERQRVIKARQNGQGRVRPDVKVLIKVLVAYREAALKLGVLLIKLGQFLSSRADLLPEEALNVLADLQDQVPAAPFDGIEEVLTTELGRPLAEVFSSIERESTAAASLGQVHKAVLVSTGETVAVKVQRPHVDELVRMDLSTLRFVIWVIQRVTKPQDFMDLNGLYSEFRKTIFEELDYVAEAANARRFTSMFENDPTIYVPRVYTQYTSRRVLVLQWIDGIKVNDYDALDAAGIDRREVAEQLVRAYLHQFFVDGLYHADPHPGNLFVQAGGERGPRIYLIDFGMCGTLTQAMQKSLKDLFLAFLQKDARALVGAMAKLGFVGKGADLESIERAVAMMLERYFGLTMREARAMDLGQVASDVEDLLYGQPFQVPTRFAFTGRAIGTLVGVTTGLSAEFNFVATATPYARQFMGLGEESSPLELVLQQLTEAGAVLLRLPRLLERVVGRLETGQIDIGVSPVAGRRGRGRRGRAALPSSTNLNQALVVSAQIASGTALLLAHQPAPGWFCMAFAMATMVLHNNG